MERKFKERVFREGALESFGNFYENERFYLAIYTQCRLLTVSDPPFLLGGGGGRGGQLSFSYFKKGGGGGGSEKI